MKKNNNIYEYINIISEIPDFLNKYLNLKILTRLKRIGYFCGMDYASKHIYDFKYKISRYDHSLSTALIVWKFTKDKKQTIAALFHDVSTPCFSHVIDYMNKDYVNQESTEEKTESILKNSRKLKELLKSDNLTINDILNFKNFTIVDNKRPKLCADRIDGIILNSLGWAKNLEMSEVKSIIDAIEVTKNEYDELELGFKSLKIAERLYELNDYINNLCQSKEDCYFMELLAEITKYTIDNNYITYNDLYKYNEDKLFSIIESIPDEKLKKLLYIFKNNTKAEIVISEIPVIKNRIINPLINGKRLFN